MMKKTPAAALSIFMASLLSGGPAQPSGGAGAATPKQKPVEEMSLKELLDVLNRANLLARPYYNGVPDPAARGRGYGEQKQETRADVLKRLSKIIIPHVPVKSFNGVTMDQAVAALSNLIRNADNGKGFNFRINPYLIAGGASGGASGGGAAGGGGAGGIPGMGQGNLPLGGGGAGGLPGGMPGAGGGAGGGAVVGLPQGIQPGALPGVGGLLGGGVGGVTMGGGNPGEFKPGRVRVTGFVSDMYNVRALDLLNDLCLSFDHPDGIEYQIMPIGIVLVERSPNNVDPSTGAPLFSRVINVRPNLFGGGLPPSTTGGGQGGGQGGGMTGGGMGGGRPGGMGMGGGMGGMGGMGGGMGGMGGGMGGMGGGMGGMGGGMGGMGGGGMGGMGGGMGGMGMGGGMMRGGMYRYGYGNGVRQAVPQTSRNQYRTFNFRRR